MIIIKNLPEDKLEKIINLFSNKYATTDRSEILKKMIKSGFLYPTGELSFRQAKGQKTPKEKVIRELASYGIITDTVVNLNQDQVKQYIGDENFKEIFQNE